MCFLLLKTEKTGNNTQAWIKLGTVTLWSSKESTDTVIYYVIYALRMCNFKETIECKGF